MNGPYGEEKRAHPRFFKKVVLETTTLRRISYETRVSVTLACYSNPPRRRNRYFRVVETALVLETAVLETLLSVGPTVTH